MSAWVLTFLLSGGFNINMILGKHKPKIVARAPVQSLNLSHRRNRVRFFSNIDSFSLG
jgi:hypothetical protein